MSSEETTWTERTRPARLERRLEFADYTALRNFLDTLAELSESCGRYPDLSFRRTSASLCIQAEEGCEELGSEQRAFAHRIDALLSEHLPEAA